MLFNRGVIIWGGGGEGGGGGGRRGGEGEGGIGRGMAPHFNFQTKQGPQVSF